MDLFTPRSDLDLSVNFTDDTGDKWNGIFCGVLPVVTARVPIVNVIDRGTGIECDITVENKDGMTRSMIFKFISSLDPRFQMQMLSYLVKFWAKIHDVNSPRERTMSSMSIISLVAFHLQTRNPPILPPFSALLKDGSDFASVERNALSFEGYYQWIAYRSMGYALATLKHHGSLRPGRKELEIKMLKISWTGHNFARSVGKKEMQKISRCLRDCALNFLDFMKGKLEISKLKILLFGRLKPYELVSKPRLKCGKRERKAQTSPNRRYGLQKEKHAVHQVVQQHPTQAKVSTQCVNKPKPWLVIIPSGFGYSLSVQLPMAPQLSRGLLGPPPPFNLVHLNNGAQLQQQGPLLPLPSKQAVGSNSGVSYAGAQQLQRSEN
uniref:Poly(A) RNA polymerase mitochondrial-like central palm domain-containing protein n=1 Tax=Leersia perrieri TaxID=77586 RepID=A0A0D9WAB1_9ORYZ